MFTRRRQHKAPKGPMRDATSLLIAQAQAVLTAKGQARCPAAPWIAAARVLLAIRHTCGWDMTTTPQEAVEVRLRPLGWAWRWEGADLVFDLPGWVQPEPVIVAVQPGLFDSIEGGL